MLYNKFFRVVFFEFGGIKVVLYDVRVSVVKKDCNFFFLLEVCRMLVVFEVCVNLLVWLCV